MFVFQNPWSGFREKKNNTANQKLTSRLKLTVSRLVTVSQLKPPALLAGRILEKEEKISGQLLTNRLTKRSGQATSHD